MINFIQSNHNTGGLNTYIIEEDFWEDLLLKIKNKSTDINNYIIEKCIYYNLQLKIFIIKFLTYLINKRGICEQEKWLEFIEYIMHNTYANDRYLLNYSISYIEEHLSSLL